jgi:FtsP/CotA-like multicopper oxidase with cupredoxin domain
MKFTFRFDRLLVAAALAAVTALSLAQAVHAGPTAPEVPSAIAVEDGYKPFLVADAVGVQIHACTLTGSSYGWSFVGPRAVLVDERGQFLMTHFGGPTWRAQDGSEVKGSLHDRVTVDPTAIDWLLLDAASTTVGADGDRLAGTKFIQRLQTTGGLAPAPETCNPGTVGAVEEVPYTAVYAFWKATGH